MIKGLVFSPGGSSAAAPGPQLGSGECLRKQEVHCTCSPGSMASSLTAEQGAADAFSCQVFPTLHDFLNLFLGSREKQGESI